MNTVKDIFLFNSYSIAISNAHEGESERKCHREVTENYLK